MNEDVIRGTRTRGWAVHLWEDQSFESDSRTLPHYVDIVPLTLPGLSFPSCGCM